MALPTRFLAVSAAATAITAALIGAARSARPPPPEREPGVTVVHPNGLPAAGATLWCGFIDPATGGPSHRRNLGPWLRGVADAAGKLRFAGDPEECVLKGDGVMVLDVARGPLETRATVVADFRCESALVVVQSEARFLLAWYRSEKGFTEVRSSSGPELALAARQLWLERGEHRHPADRKRDCAIVVAETRSAEVLAALATLTRPVTVGQPLGEQQFRGVETELPALDVRVWSAGALCSWVGPRPAEIAAALPEDWRCSQAR